MLPLSSLHSDYPLNLISVDAPSGNALEPGNAADVSSGSAVAVGPCDHRYPGVDSSAFDFPVWRRMNWLLEYSDVVDCFSRFPPRNSAFGSLPCHSLARVYAATELTPTSKPDHTVCRVSSHRVEESGIPASTRCSNSSSRAATGPRFSATRKRNGLPALCAIEVTCYSSSSDSPSSRCEYPRDPRPCMFEASRMADQSRQVRSPLCRHRTGLDSLWAASPARLSLLAPVLVNQQSSLDPTERNKKCLIAEEHYGLSRYLQPTRLVWGRMPASST